MDKDDTGVDKTNDGLLFPYTAEELERLRLREAEEAAARLLAVHPTAVPDITARDWLTREEAAKALGKTERTIDRLIKAGKLVRKGEGVPVKITKASVERVAGADALAIKRAPTIIVEQASYEALLLHKERLEGQLREKDQRLLTWEGTIGQLEAQVEEERQARTDAENLADAERQARTEAEALAEQLAADLAAERARGFWSRLFRK